MLLCPVVCCHDNHDKSSLSIQNIRLYLQLFTLFTLFVCVYLYWCPTHIVLCFCFVCHPFVYTVLPVSLDFPFFIAPSVFSDIYLITSLHHYETNITKLFNRVHSMNYYNKNVHSMNYYNKNVDVLLSSHDWYNRIHNCYLGEK